MFVNGANLRTLGVAFSTAFQGGLTGVAPSYTKVAMEVPSTTGTQEYGWLGQFPRIREWIGDRVVRSLDTQGYAIRNRSFEATVGLKRTDMEDDNIGIYTPIFQEFGRAVASFPDELVWPLLQAGSVTPCYDGQYFFDTDHPVLDAQGLTYSVSNSGGGTGAPWYLMDLSRVVKPIIYQKRKPFGMTMMDAPTDEQVFSRAEFRYGTDGRCNAGYGFWQMAYASRQPLTADTYAAARQAMLNQKGDFGRPLSIRPGTLVVGPSNEGPARLVLLAERNAQGATNIWQNTAELHVEPWLN